MRSAARLLAASAALLACGLPEPEPLTRIVAASPSGPGIPADAVLCEVRFSAAVDPAPIAAGRIVLVRADGLREAIAAVEADTPGPPPPDAVAAAVRLDGAGSRVVLLPSAPLAARTAYALVVSSRLRDLDGRTVLDPDGRRRTFVSTFETAAPPGPPPQPALTELRADAETPEAGGEYVEVANLGEAPLDLAGWRLAKRTSTGATSSCALAVAPGVAIPAGGVAVVVGGAYDGRYGVPEAALVRCGATALLGGLGNDSPPEVALLDPDGTPLATFGPAGACPEAIEKLDPAGGSADGNLGCTAGTPGWLPRGSRKRGPPRTTRRSRRSTCRGARPSR